MGILDLLRLGETAAAPDAKAISGRGETETVRRIVRELGQMEENRARYIAAFAYVLSRGAASDMEISEDETNKMVEIVQKLGHIPEEQADLVVSIANNQNELFGGTEDYLVTREFHEIATDEQRTEMLDCLFAVSAADDTITGDEEEQIRQISRELGFTNEDYIQARSAYSDKRSVLQRKM